MINKRLKSLFMVAVLVLCMPNSISAEITNPRETPVVKVVRENAGAVDPTGAEVGVDCGAHPDPIKTAKTNREA